MVHVAYGGYKAHYQTCHQYNGFVGNRYIDVRMAYTEIPHLPKPVTDT